MDRAVGANEAGRLDRPRARRGRTGGSWAVQRRDAARLHVVEGPVKAHVSALLARLGLRNRVQLAILTYEAGLLEGH